MKAKLIGLNGNKLKEINLPIQFYEEVRNDLIKRAFLSFKANSRQRYGAHPEAGKRASAKISRRRRKYRGAYGYGISRVPRKILTRRGTQFYWVGAVAPGTVKGRKAHPSKSEKDFSQKINLKEKRKALRSAISATINDEVVKARGHKFSEIPIIVEEKIENLEKTKKVIGFLGKIGLDKELIRLDKRKIRAGRGKSRGRKYKTRVGPLIIVSDDCKLLKSSKNLLGFDVAKVNLLNINLLAPGAVPGRLCIWSKKAIEKMEKENLYLDKKNGSV